MAYNDKRGQRRKKKREDRVADVNRTRGPRPTGPVKSAAPAPVGTRQPGQPIMQPEMGKVPSLGGSARLPDSKPPKTSTSPPENKGQNWRDRQGDIQLFGPNALGSAKTTYSANTGGGPIQTQVLGIPDMIRGAAGMFSDFQKARKESADKMNAELGESLRKNMVKGSLSDAALHQSKTSTTLWHLSLLQWVDLLLSQCPVAASRLQSQ